MSLQFILDMRERGLAAELTRIDLPFTTASLDVGDFLIQTAEGKSLLVAERKSLADFAASNQDGRYREQRARLMAVRGSGCAVIYVLEGAWTGNDNHTYGGGRTTEKLLQRLSTRLILRYGMPVLRSASLAETAQWCRVLLDQLTDDPTVFQPEEGLAAAQQAAMSTMATALNTVKKGNKTPIGTAHAMLSAVPGLGEKRIAALLAEKSIADLVTLSAEELAALTVGGKKLGVAIGTAIAEAFRSRQS